MGACRAKPRGERGLCRRHHEGSEDPAAAAPNGRPVRPRASRGSGVPTATGRASAPSKRELAGARDYPAGQSHEGSEGPAAAVLTARSCCPLYLCLIF